MDKISMSWKQSSKGNIRMVDGQASLAFFVPKMAHLRAIVYSEEESE
jgi:hypothetical protein